MTTLVDAIRPHSAALATEVAAAVRKFQKETGLTVEGFSVQQHYTNGRLDAELTIVNPKYKLEAF